MTVYALRRIPCPPLGGMGPMGEFLDHLTSVTNYLIPYATGFDYGDKAPIDNSSSFEDCLTIYKQLAKNCDLFQREAIKFIIEEIIRQRREIEAELVAQSKQIYRPGLSPHLYPPRKTNPWGRDLLALAEAFEVNLEKPIANTLNPPR
ncbi:MAG: hypothetical protein ABIJ81_01690 [Patescibacteria group bacterium]